MLPAPGEENSCGGGTPGGHKAEQSEVFGPPLEPSDPAQVGAYDLVARLRGRSAWARSHLLPHTGRPPHRPQGDPPRTCRRAGVSAGKNQHKGTGPRSRSTFCITAPVIDSDTEGPQPWLATAFACQGLRSLRRWDRRGTLSVPTVLLLAAGVAEAQSSGPRCGVKIHIDLPSPPTCCWPRTAPG